MKIKRLELRAFGPFSGKVLDFSSDCPGLHVVYGPNEAGKSSSLRALQALFFGFPLRTNDDFQHRYDQLLVGGCLQAGDGRELTFFRRKKNKNSLFDQQDNVLDPAVLSPFLHGLQQDQFTALYGIDHETLVKGGQGILEQQGEAGQALFAAGTGLASLKGIVDGLEAEAALLFRSKGSNQAIAVALAQYKELQVQTKQATLSSREWQEHRQALIEAEKKLAAANARRGLLNREKRQLERLKQALPYLGQRRLLLEKQAALGEVVELPADFTERRRRLEQLARDARNRRNSADVRLQELTGKSQGIAINQGLLSQGEAIEELHQGMGQYRKARVDCPQLEGRRIGCRTDAAHLLKQIRPEVSLDEIETLRPSLAKRKLIQVLSAKYEALSQGVVKADRVLLVTVKELESTRNALRQLSVVAEVDRLIRALLAGRQAGDLDGGIIFKRQIVDSAGKDCLAALSRLGLWYGPLEQVLQLAVPPGETLLRYEEELSALGDEKRLLQVAHGQLEGDLAQLDQQLREIEYAAEVPTEEELAQCRSRRDLGWQLLRRQWLEGEEIALESRAYDPEHSLPQAYERMVDISDHAADRLYREADRVQKHASLKARADVSTIRLVELSEKERQVESALAATTSRWQELWAALAIAPLPPREMQVWLHGFDKLRYQVGENAKVSRELAELEERRRELRARLVQELAALGESTDSPGEEVSPVLQFAENLLQRIQGEQARRERLGEKERDLLAAWESAQRNRDEAEAEQRQWQLRWDEAVAPLGIAGRVSPVEALDFLETLQGCFDKLQEADTFRKRIEGIARDAREFEDQVLALAKEIGPDLLGLDAPQAVVQLKGRLSQAKQDRAVVQQYAEERVVLEENHAASERELADCEEQMVGLRRQAGCESDDRLNEVELRSAEYLKIKEGLAEVELVLARMAEGVPLADLETQAQGLDPDELPGRIEGVVMEIEGRLDPEILQLSEEIGREKNELARMDGSGKASELADSAQLVLARIRRLSERYIRLRLALKFLREEIERYRAENQNPVLEIAARYFRELTRESLLGLRIDFDEQGVPVLVGLRANGDTLAVAGMSSGTRDQLYLALRLATLEWRLQSSEPMPFIVDDILINFDDQRSQATLKALSVFGERNQVILFTHQSQVIKAAQALPAGGNVFAHYL